MYINLGYTEIVAESFFYKLDNSVNFSQESKSLPKFYLNSIKDFQWKNLLVQFFAISHMEVTYLS